MNITPGVMMSCRVENLELLARRLGVPIPPIRDDYARRVVLSRELGKAIEKDRMMAEAEERRQATKAEHKRIATEIAATLGETGPRPERQILRILQAMGEEWVYGCLSDTLANPDQCAVTKAGAKRTDGGRFFAICREEASGADMPRAEFFRCFFDRPRQPRKVRRGKAKPPSKPTRDKAHEGKAVSLFAAKANCNVKSLSVVTDPKDGYWYDWADPDTGKIGQCRRVSGQWTQAPEGKRPVVLRYEKPRQGERRAPVVAEVYVQRRRV